MPSLYRDEVLDRLSHRALPPAALAQRQTEQAERLLHRAQHLEGADRALLHLALEHHLSTREMAALVGVNHGSVIRRLRRLRQRLTDPLVVALTDAACPLAGDDRDLALAYFMRRQPMRAIARQRGLPLRHVRRRIQYVRGWITGRRDGVRLTRAVLTNTH